MTLELPNELTVARAAELKALLLSALDRGEAVELSALAVSEVDVAGLQILCAARRSALARKVGLTCSPRSQSAAFCQAVAAAGFGSRQGERWLGQEPDDA